MAILRIYETASHSEIRRLKNLLEKEDLDFQFMNETTEWVFPRIVELKFPLSQVRRAKKVLREHDFILDNPSKSKMDMSRKGFWLFLLFVILVIIVIGFIVNRAL